MQPLLTGLVPSDMRCHGALARINRSPPLSSALSRCVCPSLGPHIDRFNARLTVNHSDILCHIFPCLWRRLASMTFSGTEYIYTHITPSFFSLYTFCSARIGYFSGRRSHNIERNKKVSSPSEELDFDLPLVPFSCVDPLPLLPPTLLFYFSRSEPIHPTPIPHTNKSPPVHPHPHPHPPHTLTIHLVFAAQFHAHPTCNLFTSCVCGGGQLCQR